MRSLVVTTAMCSRLKPGNGYKPCRCLYGKFWPGYSNFYLSTSWQGSCPGAFHTRKKNFKNCPNY